VHRFTERVRIDGGEIDREEVVDAFDALQPVMREVPGLTFFELATLIAFRVFEERRCDYVVLEVGLGGRWDATNVVSRPLATAITTIALDHERYLGSDIAGIALEKAGILRSGVPAIIGVRNEIARAAIEDEARRVGAPVMRLGVEIDRERRGDVLRVSSHERAIEVELALRGAHQDDNAAIAVALAWQLGVDHRAIESGVREVKWPGRLESIGGVLLDAAHNPEGMSALASYVATRTERPRVLVFGAMADKDWRSMLDSIDVEAVVLVAPRELSRAERPEKLGEGRNAELAVDVGSGLARAAEIAGERGLVIVAGSIFVMAEARSILTGEPSDPPISM